MTYGAITIMRENRRKRKKEKGKELDLLAKV